MSEPNMARLLTDSVNNPVEKSVYDSTKEAVWVSIRRDPEVCVFSRVRGSFWYIVRDSVVETIRGLPPTDS